MLADSPFTKKEEDQNGTTDEEEESTMSTPPQKDSKPKTLAADKEFSSKINLNAVLGKPNSKVVVEAIDLNIQVDNLLRK